MWSEWKKLDSDGLQEMPKKPGVYKISYSKKVNRLLGIDKEGILMIGS